MRRRYELVLACTVFFGCNGVLGIEESSVRRPPQGESPNATPEQSGGDGGAGIAEEVGEGSVAPPVTPSVPPVTPTLPTGCTLSARIIASREETTTGPSIAVLPTHTGVVWKSDRNIRYNAVSNATDALVLATDAKVFEVDSEFENEARVAVVSRGPELAVASGRYVEEATGGSYPVVAKIHAITGARVNGVNAPIVTSRLPKPPHVSSIVPNSGSYFGIAYRADDAMTPSHGRMATFNIGMNGRNFPYVSPVVATAIGFAEDSGAYGTVFVEGPGKAVLNIFDAMGSPMGSRSWFFTESKGDRIDVSQPDSLAIAGVGPQFAIVWLDTRAGEGRFDVLITLVRSNDGTRAKTYYVSEKGSPTIKHRPQVVFDGKQQSLGIAWTEEFADGTSALAFRRFASDLSRSLDSEPAKIEIVDIDAKVTFGFASGQGGWTFGFRDPTSRHPIVRRLHCTM